MPSLKLRGGNLSDRGRFLREEGGGGWTGKAWPRTIHAWPRAFSLLTNLPWLTVKSLKVSKGSCHEIFKARPLPWRRVYGLVRVSIHTEKKNQGTIDRWQDASAKWVTRVLSKEFKKGTVEEGAEETRSATLLLLAPRPQEEQQASYPHRAQRPGGWLTPAELLGSRVFQPPSLKLLALKFETLGLSCC